MEKDKLREGILDVIKDTCHFASEDGKCSTFDECKSVKCAFADEQVNHVLSVLAEATPEELTMQIANLLIDKTGRNVPDGCADCHYLEPEEGEDPEACGYCDACISRLEECPHDRDWSTNVAVEILARVLPAIEATNAKWIKALMRKGVMVSSPEQLENLDVIGALSPDSGVVPLNKPKE